MKITRRREIIFERERSVTIKFGGESDDAFCAACEAAARLVTVDEAAATLEMSSREIFRLTESGQIHFQETSRGLLLVCVASLKNLPKQNGKFLK